MKLVKIIYGERACGWGGCPPPPESYIGKVGTITRQLITSEVPAYWVLFEDGKKFVLADEELEEVK